MQGSPRLEMSRRLLDVRYIEGLFSVSRRLVLVRTLLFLIFGFHECSGIH